MGSMGSIRTQGPPNIYNTTAAIYYAVSGHWTLDTGQWKWKRNCAVEGS